MGKDSKTVNVDYMRKINICLYIIIALLACIAIILIANGSTGTSKNNDNNTTDTNEDYDVSMFETIDPTKFLELVKGDEISVVYFGRATCSYCVSFLPTLQQAQEEIGYQTYYVDISNVDTDSDDYKSMVSMINDMTETYNKENDQSYESLYGYTPAIAVVQKGKIKNIWVGYSEYETFAKWLNDNGVK